MKKIRLPKRLIFILKLIWFLAQIFITTGLVFVIIRKVQYSCIGDAIVSSFITTILIFIILVFLAVFDRFFEELSEEQKLTRKLFEIGNYGEMYNAPLFLLIHNFFIVIIVFIKMISFVIDLLILLYYIIILKIALYRFSR
jgi:hypothetical protein